MQSSAMQRGCGLYYLFGTRRQEQGTSIFRSDSLSDNNDIPGTFNQLWIYLPAAPMRQNMTDDCIPPTLNLIPPSSDLLFITAGGVGRNGK